MNIDSELNKLEEKIEIDLKNQLIKEGHVESGHLLKSIKVTLKKSNNGYTISLQANEYIQYLDDGDFLNDFLKNETNKIKDSIAEIVKQDIIQQINK